MKKAEDVEELQHKLAGIKFALAGALLQAGVMANLLLQYEKGLKKSRKPNGRHKRQGRGKSKAR